MTVVLQEIISLLVAGISGIATGIGSGLSELVQAYFSDPFKIIKGGQLHPPFFVSCYQGK